MKATGERWCWWNNLFKYAFRTDWNTKPQILILGLDCTRDQDRAKDRIRHLVICIDLTFPGSQSSGCEIHLQWARNIYIQTQNMMEHVLNFKEGLSYLWETAKVWYISSNPCNKHTQLFWEMSAPNVKIVWWIQMKSKLITAIPMPRTLPMVVLLHLPYLHFY